MDGSLEKEGKGPEAGPQPGNGADAAASPGGAAGGGVEAARGGASQDRWPGGLAANASRSAGRRAIPPKLYRIGELAAYAGTSRQTIHNYTTMGLIQESLWSGGGHRLYDETVFLRLDEIQMLRAQRRSLKEIRESLVGGQASQA